MIPKDMQMRHFLYSSSMTVQHASYNQFPPVANMRACCSPTHISTRVCYQLQPDLHCVRKKTVHERIYSCRMHETGNWRMIFLNTHILKHIPTHWARSLVDRSHAKFRYFTRKARKSMYRAKHTLYIIEGKIQGGRVLWSLYLHHAIFGIHHVSSACWYVFCLTHDGPDNMHWWGIFTSAEGGVTMNTISLTVRWRSCNMGIWSNSTSLKCLCKQPCSHRCHCTWNNEYKTVCTTITPNRCIKQATKLKHNKHKTARKCAAPERSHSLHGLRYASETSSHNVQALL